MNKGNQPQNQTRIRCRAKQIAIKCMHDYKNAIKVGNVDYMCPLCKKLLDPLEWFFMNNFKFVDVEAEKE